MIVYPFISAGISAVIAALLLSSYARSRNPSTLAWAIGFLSYTAAQAVESFHQAGYLSLSLPWYGPIRGTLVIIMFLLVYMGAVRLFTSKWIVVYGVPAFIFLYNIFLFSRFAAPEYFTLAITTVSAPFSLLIGFLFLLAYASSRDTGTLLITISWLLYFIILPFFPVLMETPLIDYWYMARIVTEFILLAGFMLATRQKKRGKRRGGKRTW
ncbi:hypothetical protein HY491_01465 [Candidatus Woesearchaeota archaeon]|nr:hypothetical protein [Candidatus Woesearchaeota archaeon]